VEVPKFSDLISTVACFLFSIQMQLIYFLPWRARIKPYLCNVDFIKFSHPLFNPQNLYRCAQYTTCSWKFYICTFLCRALLYTYF